MGLKCKIGPTEKLNLYWAPGSPFSRVIKLFLDINNIEHNLKFIRVFFGDGQHPDYLKLNSRGKVPVIQESDGFAVSECATILKYLCVTRKLADHWYPKDIKKRVEVDRALDFFHEKCMIIAGAGVNCIYDPSPNYQFDEALDHLEKMFIQDKKFINSDTEVTIADIAFSVMIQFQKGICNYKLSEGIEKYLENIRGAIPEFQKQLDESVLVLKEFLVKSGLAETPKPKL